MTSRNHAHVIDCADCSHPYVTIRKNTKYCALCRLDRNLTFVGGAKGKCQRCGEKFAPLERQGKLCGPCSVRFLNAQLAEIGRCIFCKSEDVKLLGHGIACCHQCSTDPQKRSNLHTKVVAKAQALASNPPTDDERAEAQARADALNAS